MPRRIAKIVTAVAVATAVVACTGDGASGPSGQVAEGTTVPVATPAPTPASTPTPAPTATPSPTPTPTPDLTAIGSAYLAIADIFAAKGQPAVDAIAEGGSYTPAEWGDMHQSVVDVYDEALVELDKTDFPEDLADEIKELRAYWVEARGLFAEVAADPSVDNWDEFVDVAGAYGKVGDEIRTYLGLPPRPTPSS